MVQKKEVHVGSPWPHPHGHPRAAWQAHLDSLYDDRKGVVLAVLGQQVLADPTEGEVPVIKALEVGLSCDKTLSWGDRGEGRVGVPARPLGGQGRGQWVSQWVPWGTGGKGEGVSQQDSWEDRGREEWGSQQVLWGDKEEERVGVSEGSLGKQGKRERVSQRVPWGVSQRGALPGFLHTMV